MKTVTIFCCIMFLARKAFAVTRRMRYCKWRHGGVYQRIFGIFFYRPFVLGRRAHLSYQLCKVRCYPSRLNIHQRCGVEFLSKVSFHQVLTYIINHSDFIYYCIEDKSTPNWQKRPGHIVKIMWTTQII